MASSRYRQALQILERWPRDMSKGEQRDIAVLIRKRIGETFKQGEQTVITDLQKCDKMLQSLENLCNDKHKNEINLKNPIYVGSLGLNYEAVHLGSSDDGLTRLSISEVNNETDDENKSFISRILNKKIMVKKSGKK
ncbi:Ubiquinol-cytochrome-c reductase complex assembly factor 2 [Mactra antiquata]